MKEIKNIIILNLVKVLNLDKVLLSSILLFSVAGKAQETKFINLNEAINYALENQADAKKAKLQIENSEYLIQEAKAGALPHISAIANLNYNPILQETAIPAKDFPGGDQFPGDFIVLAMGQKWNSMAGISLNQNIFNQTVFTGLKAARTTREFYQINKNLTDEQLIERVATAYYNVFVQKEQLETLDNSLGNLEKSKNIIQSLYDNGLAREIDLDRVNVQLTNTASSRQQLVNAVQLTENALKFYMGMAIEQPIELAAEDFEVEQHLLEDKISSSNRTELLVLKKQKELLELQKEARKAAYYPTVSLSANYNYLGQGEKFPIFSGMKRGVYWSDFSTIGLNVNIPIFSGMINKARVNQADIELRTVEEEIMNTELGLDFEYQNAKSQIENNWIAIQNQQTNVELAKKVVDNTENNYRLGLATLTELLEADSAFINAKNNFSNAILQYKLAEIQLLKSKGELNTLK